MDIYWIAVMKSLGTAVLGQTEPPAKSLPWYTQSPKPGEKAGESNPPAPGGGSPAPWYRSSSASTFTAPATPKMPANVKSQALELLGANDPKAFQSGVTKYFLYRKMYPNSEDVAELRMAMARNLIAQADGALNPSYREILHNREYPDEPHPVNPQVFEMMYPFLRPFFEGGAEMTADLFQSLDDYFQHNGSLAQNGIPLAFPGFFAVTRLAQMHLPVQAQRREFYQRFVNPDYRQWVQGVGVSFENVMDFECEQYRLGAQGNYHAWLRLARIAAERIGFGRFNPNMVDVPKQIEMAKIFFQSALVVQEKAMNAIPEAERKDEKSTYRTLCQERAEIYFECLNLSLQIGDFLLIPQYLLRIYQNGNESQKMRAQEFLDQCRELLSPTDPNKPKYPEFQNVIDNPFNHIFLPLTLNVADLILCINHGLAGTSLARGNFAAFPGLNDTLAQAVGKNDDYWRQFSPYIRQVVNIYLNAMAICHDEMKKSRDVKKITALRESLARIQQAREDFFTKMAAVINQAEPSFMKFLNLGLLHRMRMIVCMEDGQHEADAGAKSKIHEQKRVAWQKCKENFEIVYAAFEQNKETFKEFVPTMGELEHAVKELGKEFNVAEPGKIPANVPLPVKAAPKAKKAKGK